MGLQRVEVDFDDPIKVHPGVGLNIIISAQKMCVLISQISYGLATRGLQVKSGFVVVAKDRRCGTDFGAHVADGGPSGGADVGHPAAEVLHNGAGTALHREHVGHLQDDVLGAGPSAHGAGELDADELGVAHAERKAHHHVHRISTTDTHRNHAQPAGVGGMAVGTDHHAAGECVLLQHHLVDDARARLPEPDAVLGADRAEKVVHLAIGVVGHGQIGVGTYASLDEMVTVNRAGHGHLG